MPQMHQLAAIMFVDIMGYTSTMERDEVLAMSLRDKLRKKLEMEVGIHGGRIIKFSGDGAICSFVSAIESIKAGLALQLFMQEEPPVPLRMGIHQADVIFEESDVHGDGVNIASRLESFAIPGSILISSKVRDDIKNQKDIQTVSLGKYTLKNVAEPMEIFAICNNGLKVPLHIKLEGKGVKYKEHRSRKKIIRQTVVLAFSLLTLGLVGFLYVPRWLNTQKARTEWLPEIQKLVNDNFRPPTKAFDLATDAEKYIPNDSALIKLWPIVSATVSVETTPAGAEVFWKDYVTPDAPWRSAGITPLKNIRFPRSFLRMEIRKKGYQTIEYEGPAAYRILGPEIEHLKLDKEGTLPENMVRVTKKITGMAIVGLEEYGGKEVGEFLMDKYEVTNAQFKIFLDAGGYVNPVYWKIPFFSGDKIIPLEKAIPLFIDRTGRQGPAGWEAGNYPEGQGNYPVSGISWYEAAAYAAYALKQLPTVFHWGRVLEVSRTEFIVPLSNFNGKSTTPVGIMPGFCSFGIYDLAGNVREWCYNESSIPGQRYILGGGWNDPTYSFNDSYTQPAMDRSITNGFRCVKELPGDSAWTGLTKSVSRSFRDYHKEKPVDDKTFEIFLRAFTYDKSPLNAKVEASFQNEFWTSEKITFDATYNNERMEAYVYLPKNGKKPYQTIIFFPGSGDIHSNKFDPEINIAYIDFILKSGRALVYPIFKGTLDRKDNLKSDLQDSTVFYKDHVIMWRKDFSRTLDYLETRNDIQHDKIGYLGYSWGGFMGGILPAIEKRIKVVVLNVGGMAMEKSLPEVDQINFLPRIKQPLLMQNGMHDMFFPVETSQKPMFELLGTAKENKKIIIYPTGHLVPRIEFMKETLDWYDLYLGPVK